MASSRARVVIAAAATAAAGATVLGIMTSSGDRVAGRRAGTIFVGDSITSGVSPETPELSPSHSWVTYAVGDDRSPWRLQANAALPGRTLLEMEAAFVTDVVDRRPLAVVIMGGTNDVLAGVPTDDSIAALRTMVEVPQGQGIDVWLVAPPPLPAEGGRSMRLLVRAQAELARELDVPFADPTAAVGAPAGGWRAHLTTDGV
ncbi:MAG: SGNH/GDSL hydrolase family protein, partial [Nocardioides sp.]